MKPEAYARKLLPKGAKLVYLTEYGSKLYGTNSVKSDTDYKGIYLPSLKSVILGTAVDVVDSTTGQANSKNTDLDIDITLYSVQKFFTLIKKGETGALDLLFSMNSRSKIKTSPLSKAIYKAHPSLVSANSHAFIGYCMGQASKYGIKGSRYGDLLKFSEYLDKFDDPFSLEMPASTLEIGEFTYIQKITKSEQTYISVLGKLYPVTRPISRIKDLVTAELTTYGARAKAASGGTDWKALSHALRVILELKDLASTGTITFPLVDKKQVMDVKYNTDQTKLDSILDTLAKEIEETREILNTSNLPTEIDQDLIDSIIIKAYKI